MSKNKWMKGNINNLGRKVISCCQVFKPQEAVPQSGSTSAGIIVHNLYSHTEQAALNTCHNIILTENHKRQEELVKEEH